MDVEKCIEEYIDTMVMIFNDKYSVPEFLARKLIAQYNYETHLIEDEYCLHEDAESFVDDIYLIYKGVIDWTDYKELKN